MESLLALFAAIFSIFESNSKEAPIVTAATPVIINGIKEAQTMNIPNTDKTQHVVNLVTDAATVGALVSGGGQAHTYQEAIAAAPVLAQTVSAVYEAVKAGLSPTAVGTEAQ